MKRSLLVLTVLLGCARSSWPSAPCGFLICRFPSDARRTSDCRRSAWPVSRLPCKGTWTVTTWPASSRSSRVTDGWRTSRAWATATPREGADGTRYDLSAGLDDQADRCGGSAGALRTGALPAFRPNLEVASRVQGHEGLAAGAGWGVHNGARANPDHYPALTHAYERAAEQRRRAASGLREACASNACPRTHWAPS